MSHEVSRGATLLLKLLVSTKDRTWLDRVRWSALLRARQMLVRISDPVVEYDFCGTKLHLPFSHDLPIYRRTLPMYSDNLGRIAAQLSTKYGDLEIIDVGANVGDTAALIHSRIHVPILCIEGDPRFVELLRANVAGHRPTSVVEQSFIGTSGESLIAVVHDGTARLVHTQSNNGESIQTKSFDQILEAHPSFRGSRLLKIDTDGMDIAILNSAYNWISRQKPVLFFEYDPDLQRDYGSSGLKLLGKLKEVGYRRVLVYENTGDFMCSCELENERLLSELHEFFSGRKSGRYCDLCIFHGEDDDIAEVVRRCELDVFRRARHFTTADTPDV